MYCMLWMLPSCCRPRAPSQAILLLACWPAALLHAGLSTGPACRFKHRPGAGAHHAALLQQIGAHARAADLVRLVEVDLNQLAEAVRHECVCNSVGECAASSAIARA